MLITNPKDTIINGRLGNKTAFIGLKTVIEIKLLLFHLYVIGAAPQINGYKSLLAFEAIAFKFPRG